MKSSSQRDYEQLVCHCELITLLRTNFVDPPGLVGKVSKYCDWVR